MLTLYANAFAAASVSYMVIVILYHFFFSSRRRHTRYIGDWSSDVCSSDLKRRASSTYCSRTHLLREIQLPLQKLLHKGDIEPLFVQTFFHGLAENLRPVALQKVVESIHVHPPPPGPAMDQLGEIANRRFP